MKTIQLEWKSFKVSLQKIDEIAKSIDGSCCGISANSKLEVHFVDNISEEKEQQLKDYWDSLTEESEEAKSYKTRDQVSKEKEEADKAAKASAAAKLKALGLTDSEISAMIGR